MNWWSEHVLRLDIVPTVAPVLNLIPCTASKKATGRWGASPVAQNPVCSQDSRRGLLLS